VTFVVLVNTQKVKQKTTPPSLPISGSAAAHFFAADFWIGSDTVYGCRFMDRQRRNTWLSISETVVVQFDAADF
jgi:hypothetical protein